MIRRLASLAFVILLGLAFSACARLGPYRTLALTPAGDIDPIRCSVTGPRDGLPWCEGAQPGQHALQHRHYRYAADFGPDGTPTALTNADYYLAFVEFDDQGWFADRGQMEALFALLGRIEREDRAHDKNGHALVIVYAHGWKHNADRCDGNVLCFARVLERMDILEREREQALGRKTPERPRRVVGVYVGWRGLSLTGPMKQVTFWTRKSTAERVGRGGVKELFTRLNEYRSLRNSCRRDDQTQLVIAGHSFGGLVAYSALSHALMERATDAVRCDARRAPGAEPGSTCYGPARSFGDFLLLVNPAFEGSLYEPLFHVTTNRCYDARQRPVMMTVTSREDRATGALFPLGRMVSTVFQVLQGPRRPESIVSAIGHDARYQTHALRWRPRPGVTVADDPGSEPGQPVREPTERACGCPYLDATEKFRWRAFAENVRGAVAASRARGGVAPPSEEHAPEKPRPESPARCQLPPAPSVPGRDEPEGRVYDYYGPHVRLVGDPKYSANYPYLVVKADEEIIADHNAIYNEPFIRFLHSFYLLHIANRQPFEPTLCVTAFDGCKPGGPVPCERSCRREENAACTALPPPPR